MTRLGWALTAFLAILICWVLIASPAGAVERQIAYHQGITASIDSGFGCARQTSITVHAPDDNAYTGDRIALQRLLVIVRAGLGAECPTLSEIDIAGLAAGKPAFYATITAANGWVLPSGAEDRPAAAAPIAPLAARTSTCDYNVDDPLVGCWVTISPPQWRGAILNIRNDEKNSWFNDWPEKLADGSTSKIGTRIQRVHMPGFGPSLELVDSEGWRANRKGPFFAEGCSIMRIDPAAEPINTMLGMLTGEVPEPAYFVRLRSPLRITADILKESDTRDGGLTGHPGDAEIVEGIPEDGRVPAFNRCVDNFDEDGELLLDVLLVAIPATRIQSLVFERNFARLTRVARTSPGKYHPALQVGVDRPSARPLGKNEGILLRRGNELQTRQRGLFDNVIFGTHGDNNTKYLWTIDKRGLNIALEKTPMPTERGFIVHTNISRRAAIGGEAWFRDQTTVIINAGSGRFGDGAGVTAQQWRAAQAYWEALGYRVEALPLGRR